MVTVRIFKGQPLNKGPEVAFHPKKSWFRTAVSQLAAGNFTLRQLELSLAFHLWNKSDPARDTGRQTSCDFGMVSTANSL